MCVLEAHLPITIEIKDAKGTKAIHVEEHGEPEETYDDELGDSSMGKRLRYHVNMIRIHLESIDDEGLTKRWIYNLARVLFTMLSMLVQDIPISKSKQKLLNDADQQIDDEVIREETKKQIHEIFDGIEQESENGLPKATETSITEIDVSTRAQNALSKMAWTKGYEPPFDSVMLSVFKDMDVDKFYQFNNVGQKTVKELKQEFKNYKW